MPKPVKLSHLLRGTRSSSLLQALSTHNFAFNVLFGKVKTIAKTALNYRRCSGMLGRTRPLICRSRGCGLGVVKEQVDGWG